MKKFLLSVLACLLMATTTQATTDSTVVKFNFTTTADTTGTYQGELCNGATLGTMAGLPVLRLGNNNGYFNLSKQLGNYIATLDTFSISTDVYIPDSTDITGNGNFVWCFANSSSTGYMMYEAKASRFAITKTNYTGESSLSIGSPMTKGKWQNLVYVQRGKRAYIWINGTQIKNGTITILPTELGATTDNSLGRSCYSGDNYLKGAIYHDFRIYNYELKYRDLHGKAFMTDVNKLNYYTDSVKNQQLISTFTLENTTDLMDDITLPDTYADSVKITWATSDANVITNTGHITRPVYGSKKATAVLTAYLVAGAARDTMQFTVTVLPEFSDAETLAYDMQHLQLKGINNLYSDVVLPTVGTLGSVIVWKSSDTSYLTNTGHVAKLPTDGKKHITLTATLMRGQEKAEKAFDVYLHQQEPYKKYLFVYFPSNSDENLYYAISDDGYNYTPLNNGQPFLKADTTTIMGGLRDPHILRGNDGYFYMVATDMRSALGWASNRGMVLFRSTDLLHWTHHTVHFPTKYEGTNLANVTRVWAPETIWDEKAGKYMVYFSLLTNDGTIPYDKDYYCYANSDFSDLEGTPIYLYDRGSATIDMDIVYNETDSLYHGFFKNEGQGGICQVTARSLTPDEGQPDGSQWSAPSGTLQQTTEAVEGAGVFKLINQDNWILMYDCYQNGHYQFCSSSDLNTFKFVQNTVTHGAFTPRHGTVIPITETEAATLLKALPVSGVTPVIQTSANPNVKTTDLYVGTDSVFIPVNRSVDVSSFDPMFTVTAGATVTPAGEQDFSKGAVTYTLAYGNNTKQYKVVTEADGNPILPGFHADPEVLFSRKTGRFYVYPTTDGISGWGGYSFDVFSSPDLLNFTNEGTIINMQNGDVAWATGNAWAPCIEEKWVDGKWKYYFYFSGNNPSAGKKTLGVATAESPTGPFKAEKNPLFLSSKAGQMIDSDVFTDPESGQSYLYYGNGSMCYRLLNDDMVSTTGSEYVITPTGGSLSDYAFREGTYVFYRNGIYYFMWSVDDTGAKNYHVAYGTSKSPTGPIQVASQPIVIIQQPDSAIYGTGHNSVVNVPGTDDWYIVYHRINNKYLNNQPGVHREVCVDKLTFAADGSIVKVTPTRHGIDPVNTDSLINSITAIADVTDKGAQTTSVTYYTVDGINLGSKAPAASGLYIRRELLSNGKVRSLKILK